MKHANKILVNLFKGYESILSDLDKKLDREPVLQIIGYPARVFVSKDPEFARQVYTHPTIGITKYPRAMPRVVQMFQGEGTLVLEGGELWRERRAVTQKAFHPDTFDAFLAPITPIVEKYLCKWIAQPKNQSFDVFCDLKKMVTEINFKFLFEKDLSGPVLEVIADATFLLDLKFLDLTPQWLPTPSNNKFKKSVRVIHGILNKIIKDNSRDGARSAGKTESDLTAGKTKNALVGYLMQNTSSPQHLLGELCSVYFGASVMSSTLAWAMYLVGRSENDLKRLREESLSLDWSSEASRAFVTKMPLAQAATKEVMRLYPGSWSEPRYTKEDVELLGYQIPANSLLLPIVYLTHRHQHHWHEPRAFILDRFLKLPENFNKFAYAPFGIGKRSCVGAGIASLILPLVLSRIVRDLNFKFAPRFDGDPKADFGFEIHPQDEVRIINI